MDNHVHLLIETTFVDISKIMYNLNKDYAVYFNQKYHFVGHLFQGRFRWELVDNDPYYLEVSRYIHLNPVKAEMMERPQEYSWSSYQSYVQEDTENTLVDTDKIFLTRVSVNLYPMMLSANPLNWLWYGGGIIFLIYLNKKELEEIIWEKYYLEDC